VTLTSRLKTGIALAAVRQRVTLPVESSLFPNGKGTDHEWIVTSISARTNCNRPTPLLHGFIIRELCVCRILPAG
jgi:hypothetical protein